MCSFLPIVDLVLSSSARILLSCSILAIILSISAVVVSIFDVRGELLRVVDTEVVKVVVVVVVVAAPRVPDKAEGVVRLLVGAVEYWEVWFSLSDVSQPDKDNLDLAPNPWTLSNLVPGTLLASKQPVEREA